MMGETEMKYVLLMLMCAAMSLASVASRAESQSPPMINKYAEKLLGTWTSPSGEVTFNPNSTIVYKGKKHFCAIAQDNIQINRHKIIVNLPYHFLNGNLVVTDNHVATTYTRVP